MIAFPALTQALQDRRLRPGDYRVYGYAIQHCNLETFTPLKARAVKHAVGLRREQVTRALRRLATCGYLVAGPLEGHTRTWRLTYRAPTVPTSAHNQAA